MLSFVSFIFALLLVAPWSVSAGEFTFLTEHPGKLTATVTGSHLKLSKPEAAAFNGNLLRLRDLLAKQPVFNPPRGVEVIGYFRPNDEQPKTKQVPIPGFGYLRFHFYHADHKTGRPVRICCTTDEIYVTVNDPDRGLDVFGNSGFPTRVFYEPKQVAEVAGFPVYRMDNGDEVVVLSRGKTPPWVPVTREEYLNAGLKQWQKAADESSLDTLSPQVVKNHREALSAMTPQERKLPARYYPFNPMEPTLAPVGSDEGRALVRTREAWFDPALPRAAFQLLTLRFCYTNNLDHDAPGVTAHGDVSPYRVWQALHGSNWAEIAAALTAK